VISRPTASNQNCSNTDRFSETNFGIPEEPRFRGSGGSNPFYRKFLPSTTVGFLAAIMISALLPLLVIQTAIYIFWYKTRSQTEIDANVEFARAAALSFFSYVNDVQRQELALGQLMHVGSSLSREAVTALLAASKRQYPTIVRFSIADPQGVILASSDPDLVGVSVAGRIDFRHAAGGTEWMLGDLGVARPAEKPTFTIVRRIGFVESPQLFVIAVIDPDRLGELTFSRTRPSEGMFTLFDRKGTLVYISGEQRQIGHPNWKESDPILAEAMEGKERAGIISYPLDHARRIVARVPVSNLGWIAGASRPASVAFAPIYETLVWAVVLNCAVLAISLAGAIGLSRYLIRRLDFLQAYARRVADGDYSSQSNDTKLKELAELENSFTVMAEQVRARQRELESAIQDLRRSNQELEQFAYISSHDLQEPLRVISGFVQLIAKRYKGHLDKDADKYIGFITDAVARQQQLIMGILAFSRVGRKSTNPAPCDANRALETALANIQQTIREAEARVIHDHLPMVRAYESELIQLFQNLVSNGIKFRSDRNPEIRISAQREDAHWIFAVGDNGIGIEPQYWEQIFVMFKRLHTRKDYSGTGIGLAICKKIVERHGGRIWLKSKPGEGSVFYFTLPAAEKNDESERE
jgi:signal transduction histidine kinase